MAVPLVEIGAEYQYCSEVGTALLAHDVGIARQNLQLREGRIRWQSPARIAGAALSQAGR
jgi:hypothetical protein